MDMDHLIGQRFNLISKSEIRYVGTLHEINPEQSTIALEDVYSFGTEGRRSKSEGFIPASSQKFDYIVFRGSDVKDIKIADDENKLQQPSPPNVLDDPAILNSSRPPQPQQQLPGPLGLPLQQSGPPGLPPQSGPPPQHRNHSPFPPPGYPPQPQFPGYYAPPQQYGRGYGPPPPGGFGPGAAFQNMPYGPPPPGYYGPPGQGFQQGPSQFPHPPPPIGPPGQRPQVPPGQQERQPQQQAPTQSQPQQQQSGSNAQGPKTTSELPVDTQGISKPTSKTATPAPSQNAPPPPTAPPNAPPVESKPAVSEVRSTGPPAATPTPAATVEAPAAKSVPTGPKSTKVAPAMPMTVNQRSFVPVSSTTDGPSSATAGNNAQQPTPMPSLAAMEETSRQAREAVAAAMAKLAPQATAAAKAAPSSSAMDVLTKKVGEMRTTDGAPRGRGGLRGHRGGFRGGSGGAATRKIEIPKSDYDFELANAKFNKGDLIKEAIASGSPVGEPAAAPEAENGTNGTTETEVPTNGEKRKDTLPLSATQAYNKSSSFFDNISSESRDREEGVDARGGRGVRNEEYKKNVETFGQGNIDGGYRGRGGRGRGRGHGRGTRPYGGQHRGAYGRGGFGQNQAQPQPQPQQAQAQLQGRAGGAAAEAAHS